MHLLSTWARLYLKQLNLFPEPPSFSFLSKICRAHLTTYPFENISKLIYFHHQQENGYILPSIDDFLKNHETYHFGGTCYILNANLFHLLKECGFQANLTMLGTSHMAILVELPEFPNERLYVDCGSAAPLFEPVRFETNPHHVSSFGKDEILIRPKQGKKHHYTYLRYTDGQLRSAGEEWVFDIERRYSFQDFLPSIHRSYQPGAFFLSILRCQLWQLDQQRSVSLSNNKFSIRYQDGRVTNHYLSSPVEIEEVMRDEFRLPRLPVRKAIEILEKLEVDIFQPDKKEKQPADS
ncbi:arylamine N-acetyltransferase [Thermoflavimicrobium dichotomicum]|uniref:Arylamine N-acetyltransferase n=1 Tax=Thermoflavimicrobium dichotomicum TaxID=46223 RepID=A0A1I3SU66_9BACL|nr:arylamine N-acetyltransferase [Thermoflavimicrobium dichotomicum]SFJ61389.1 Arylamine N-acetyltransferase [Thermoflavimicrobium dichotomicum]